MEENAACVDPKPLKWIVSAGGPVHGQRLVTAETELKIRSGADEPGQGRPSPERRVKPARSRDLVLVVARRGVTCSVGPGLYPE